ncbi:hypothetical protein CA601_43970 [Paraburkholderia hospita]|nr:hypothetical protein CA601_43970 [Paraburkholderia hospita]
MRIQRLQSSLRSGKGVDGSVAQGIAHLPAGNGAIVNHQRWSGSADTAANACDNQTLLTKRFL